MMVPDNWVGGILQVQSLPVKFRKTEDGFSYLYNFPDTMDFVGQVWATRKNVEWIEDILFIMGDVACPVNSPILPFLPFGKILLKDEENVLINLRIFNGEILNSDQNTFSIEISTKEFRNIPLFFSGGVLTKEAKEFLNPSFSLLINKRVEFQRHQTWNLGPEWNDFDAERCPTCFDSVVLVETDSADCDNCRTHDSQSLDSEDERENLLDEILGTKDEPDTQKLKEEYEKVREKIHKPAKESPRIPEPQIPQANQIQDLLGSMLSNPQMGMLMNNMMQQMAPALLQAQGKKQ